MKQFVDLNIEIVVGVAISFLVKGSQIYPCQKFPDQDGQSRPWINVETC